MGTLTLSQMKAEVRAALGGRIDLDSRLTSILNLAQQRLARIHDFDEMEIISTTTVSNSSSTNDKYIVLPDKREVYSVVVLDGAQSRKLVQRTPQWFDRHISMPEHWSRNTPTDYIIWNNTIEIYPLADRTYTVRVRWTKWPTILSDDDQTSEFLQKDDVLIELAASYALMTLGKEDDAAKHERMAMRLLGESANMDDSKPDMNITPSESDGSIIHGLNGEYWNNPFIKDIS